MSEILINVLFLLVILLITQHILEVYKKKITRKLISIYLLIAGSISIFFCMSFPLLLNEGFNMDIRIVPLYYYKLVWWSFC